MTITGVALQRELDDIEYLVEVTEGQVAIVHPAFSEYVRKVIYESGLQEALHEAISTVYTAAGYLHLKVYHLVCAGKGADVYDDLPSAEILAYQTGYMRVASRLFCEDIVEARARGDMLRVGFAVYHTALIKQSRYGNFAAVRTASTLSLE